MKIVSLCHIFHIISLEINKLERSKNSNNLHSLVINQPFQQIGARKLKYSYLKVKNVIIFWNFWKDNGKLVASSSQISNTCQNYANIGGMVH